MGEIEMRDQDKPFVLYRKGPMNFTIVPRGLKGWGQFGIWMMMLVPPSLWFTNYAATHDEGSGLYLGLAFYLGSMLVWTVGGIWWMKARAEVVDVNELLKREAERKRTRR
jgi:hypothetical protein